MRKLLLIVSLAFFTQVTFSQVIVEDQNINDLNIKYIQLIGINKSMFGVKIQVYVDYGQKAKFMKADSIKDKNGKAIKFNSMIDALNFMNANGWKFVNYTEGFFSGKLRYVYLLEKL